MNKLLQGATATFFVVILSGSVLAEESKRFKLNGKMKAMGIEKIYDDDTLTPKQIVTCLESSEKLEAFSTDLHARVETFPAKLSKISALSDQIESEQTYLDKNPTKEINDDAKMTQRNKRVAEFNAMVSKYNQITEAYSKEAGNYTADNTSFTLERAFFKEACAGKQYFAEDMNAVTSGK